MGEHNYILVKIPPKIINGFKNTGTKECIVANCSSIPHDKSEIIRYSPYDKAFDYNWDIVFKYLMDKILVVGGTGFIGSHLVDNLLKNCYEVANLFLKKKV